MKRISLFICGPMIFIPFYAFAASADIQPQPIKPDFQEIDTNKNGFITSPEMQAYQEKKFNEVDKDKNGVIDKSELNADETRALAKADQNKDQNITKSESLSQFKQYFNQMDANKDGQVSETEFKQYWPIVVKF